jgi:predicted nucleotidyltransferase
MGAVVPLVSTQERLLKCARQPPAVMLDRHRDDVLAAATRRKLANVRIFGSVARNMDTLTSDIDLLVTATPGASLFDLVGFAAEIEAFLGYSVDVVSDRNIDPESADAREALLL